MRERATRKPITSDRPVCVARIRAAARTSANPSRHPPPLTTRIEPWPSVAGAPSSGVASWIRPQIERPFANVSMHVVEAECVRMKRARRDRTSWGSIERLGAIDRVAKRISSASPGPAGILPFRFGRQPVGLAGRRRQATNKCQGVVKGNKGNRRRRQGIDADGSRRRGRLGPAKERARLGDGRINDRRELTHSRLILVAKDREEADREWRWYLDPFLRPFHNCAIGSLAGDPNMKAPLGTNSHGRHFLAVPECSPSRR